MQKAVIKKGLIWEETGFIIYHNGGDILLSFEIKANYAFEPGRMYLPNGDPGYPDYEEFDISSIKIEEIKYWTEDGEWEDLNPDQDERRDIEYAIEQIAYDNIEKFN